MNNLIKIKENLYDLKNPVVMGILNITPDSFYTESRKTTEFLIYEQIEQILSQNINWIDIGAYSTRPSAAVVSIEEEKKRLSYAFELILKKYSNLIISVDTFRSEIAKHVVCNYGVAIINDISGGTLDKNMFSTIAELKTAYILMHMRGTPQTMQEFTQYENVTAGVMLDLKIKLEQLRKTGVHDVIIDPGFGFSKTLEQNYKLLKDLACFKELGAPILVGLSRKSMIQKLLNVTAEHALNGTTALNMLALLNGASILRVHDVKEAIETIKIFKQWQNA